MSLMLTSPTEKLKINPSLPKLDALREAAKQFAGQGERKDRLFIDILCDIVSRVETLERERHSIENFSQVF